MLAAVLCRHPGLGRIDSLRRVPVGAAASLHVPGNISLTVLPMIYSGQYAIQKTNFGFLWLDTAALRAGLVQVEAKCGVGQAASATGLYVLGDCNGIANVSRAGDTVLARQFSGQCGTATDGCGGGRDEEGGTGMFAFRLGTWE